MVVGGKKAIKDYQGTYSLEERKEKAKMVLEHKINHVPILAFPNQPDVCAAKVVSKDGVKRNCTWFIVERERTFAEFARGIRKHISNLTPAEALFFITENDIMLGASMSIGGIYEKYKNEDGFLYVVYSKENTFGKYDCEV